MKIKPEQESKKTRRTRTTIIFLSLTTLFLALVFNELSLILIIISILAISVLLLITKVDGNDGLEWQPFFRQKGYGCCEQPHSALDIQVTGGVYNYCTS